MKRGDIIITAPFPLFSKPRPAVIVQAILLGEVETITAALITSDLTWASGLRVGMMPSERNGLRKPSQVMVDMLVTVQVSRIGGYAGVAEPEVMKRVDDALRLFLGL